MWIPWRKSHGFNLHINNYKCSWSSRLFSIKNMTLLFQRTLFISASWHLAPDVYEFLIICSSNHHSLSVTIKVRPRNLTLTCLTHLKHTCQHSLSCWQKALPPSLPSLPAGLSAHFAPLRVQLSAERSGHHEAEDSPGEPMEPGKEIKVLSVRVSGPLIREWLPALACLADSNDQHVQSVHSDDPVSGI